MKKLIRDFLSFSAGERKGVLLLIVLLVIITGINAILIFQKPTTISVNHVPLPEDIKAFEESIGAGPVEYQDEKIHEPETETLFNFDPNRVSSEELRRLGLSSRQITTFMNYRASGGRFYDKDDIEKIYGLSSWLCKRLKEYAVIGQSPLPSGNITPAQTETGTVKIDINRADTALFIRLPGIGPVLAARIIKYRNLLGGFYEVRQLREVYGISDSLFVVIRDKVYADTGRIRKMDLNKSSEWELSRHPYVGKYTARGIMAYRRQADTIEDINELKINGLITQKILEKLKNYVVF